MFKSIIGFFRKRSAKKKHRAHIEKIRSEMFERQEAERDRIMQDLAAFGTAEVRIEWDENDGDPTKKGQ